MSIEISTNFNGKCHTVNVGDITLLFSYETLVGFSVPEFGRVKCKNIWGSTSGKHINSWAARLSGVDNALFNKAAALVDLQLSGCMTRNTLIKKLMKMFPEHA